MATPTGNRRKPVDASTRDSQRSEHDTRCPHCEGSGWVKSFTPWGCPTNTRCTCQISGLTPDSAPQDVPLCDHATG